MMKISTLRGLLKKKKLEIVAVVAVLKTCILFLGMIFTEKSN